VKSPARKFATERVEAKTRRQDRIKPPLDAPREVSRASAPPTANAREADTAAAPTSSASQSIAPAIASWKGELLAHINRYKRFPAGAARSGTASVAFSIDHSGAVIAARLVGSAGDAALDAEAVALLHRASPVPPPPPEIARGVIVLTVPIRFNP
jgi:protein TonB